MNLPPPNPQVVGTETTEFVGNSRLWEGLPSHTNRYDDVYAGPRSQRIVRAGLIPTSTELDNEARPRVHPVPDGWQQYVHPVEGRVYFYNSENHIVTEAYIRHPDKLALVNYWFSQFVSLRENTLPTVTGYDLFLDPQGRDTCRYYMVDHDNKTVYWLRERSTSDIGLSDVRSTIGLHALLYEEYWTHSEYMPKNENHLAAAYTELLGDLAACLLDHMTSEGSTSPFTKTESESYLFALNKAAESSNLINLNWCVARVMGLLVHSRNVNLYGQYGARLDRTATVEDRRHPARSRWFLYRNKVLGGGPLIHLARLEHLWVDRVIYTHHWRSLLGDLFEEWTMSAGAAGVMWASNMVFVASSGVNLPTKLICAASGMLAGASGIFSLALLREHRALGRYAAHAATYFQQNEQHTTGLQELAVRFSLPWAGVLWSVAATSGAVVLLLVTSLLALLGPYTHFLVTAVLVAGVYVHARGPALFAQDLRGFTYRVGITGTPQSPRVRGRTSEPKEDELLPLDLRHS